jgi:hypothetical protein
MSRISRLRSAFKAITGALEKAAKTNLTPKRTRESIDFLEKEAPADTRDFLEIPAESGQLTADNPVHDSEPEPPVKVVIPASALREEADTESQAVKPFDPAAPENADVDSPVPDDLVDGLLVKMNGGRRDESRPTASLKPRPSGSGKESKQPASLPSLEQPSPGQTKPATQTKEYLNKWLNKLVRTKTQTEPESQTAVATVPTPPPVEKEETEALMPAKENGAEIEATSEVPGEAAITVEETSEVPVEAADAAEETAAAPLAGVVTAEGNAAAAEDSIAVSEEKAKVLEEKAKVLDEKAKVLDEKAKVLEEKVKAPEEKAGVPEENPKLPEEKPKENPQPPAEEAGGEKNLFASLFGKSEVFEETPIDRLIKSLPDITIAEVMNRAEEVKGLMNDWFQNQEK